MSDRPLFTNDAALAGANAVAISIANPDATPSPLVGKIRLFNGDLVPDAGTTKTQLEDAETELTGYPSGGYDLTEFAGAVFAPLGGAVVTSNLVNVAYTSGDTAVIGGYWVEDSEDAVRLVFTYDPPRTLAQVGDGFPIVVQLGYGAN